jgi:hypothetical protein
MMVLSVLWFTHLFRFAPLKSGIATSIWRQEGYMAPKPEPAEFASVFGTLTSAFGIVLAVAAILAITTPNWAEPMLEPIYRLQLLLLY